MPPSIQTLTSFSADPCRLSVLLAREASRAVILRRGPSAWWRVTLWDTARDTFEPGQWFHGRLYPQKCDLSPDGKLFVYFAGKFRQRDVASGYSLTWTAVSRPPYLTALALWPIGDAWGGEGVFLDNHTVRIATSSPSFGAKHHPDHPPGPLTVVEYCSLSKDDPRRNRQTCSLSKGSGEQLNTFGAHWLGRDQQGRLIATAGGRVLGASVRRGKLTWRQLAGLHEEKPAPMPTPAWAQRW